MKIKYFKGSHLVNILNINIISIYNVYAMKDTINIIWFKKDLRITDNQCLFEYETSLPTIAVYFFESDIIRQSDFSDFHLQFIVSSLIHLESSLKKI